MQLRDLLPSIWPQDPKPVQEVHIFPQYVTPGDLFVSLPSRTSDQAEQAKIACALKNGAAVVIKRRDLEYLFPPNVIHADVADPRKTMAEIASRLTAGQPEVVAGITGTCSKTSVASFARQTWRQMGFLASSMGSLGVLGPQEERVFLKGATASWGKTRILHGYLKALKQRGSTHLALELTSAALEQRRADAVQFKAGVFTNLSFEHLNYHKTMEDYFDAKARLFSELLDPGSLVVVNVADQYAEKVLDICALRKHHVITYGTERADLHLASIHSAAAYSELTLSLFGATYSASFCVPALFQAQNLLPALGLVMGLGSSPESVVATIPCLEPVPGRFECVGVLPNGASVYVDFAHKPAGLEAVLQEARHLASPKGKVTVVFGCDGNADAQKRPLMGEIAHRFADRVIITDDHPRNADTSLIRGQILEACPDAYEIPSRLNAIKCAIRTLGAGDICIIVPRAVHGYSQEQTGNFAKEEIRIAREALQCLT